jgi:signal transduction histidine kinase
MLPLDRLRFELTAWYVGVFAVVLFVMGLSLLGVLTHHASDRLDRSLENATLEIVRAAEIREHERHLPEGAAVDAFDELRIPGRMLFVFDERGGLVHPSTAPEWVGRGLLQVLGAGDAWLEVKSAADGEDYRMFVHPFMLPDAGGFVAIAAADVIELNEEYAGLIIAFGLAGLGALVLAAFGGVAMARRSTEPVVRTFAQMRRFMADAAHELRTPLTILHGHADVALQRPRSAEEYASALRTIRDETGRMNSLVERLLHLGQAGPGELRIRRDPMFLDDALIDAGEEARLAADRRNVSLDIQRLDETPLTGDTHLVRQMFRNVLENAIRYSPEGSRVTASIAIEHGEALATVADTGPGISPEDLPHVFEPFYRSDRARGGNSGAGLGLAIARSIAEAHGARIDIESKVGFGTRVRIRFPR